MDFATGLTSHAPLELVVRVLLITRHRGESNRDGRVAETPQQRRELLARLEFE